MSLLRQFVHTLDNRGLRHFFTPTLQTRAPEASPHGFDRLHQVDTGGYIPGQLLRSGLPADFYNTAYYAISPSTLAAALADVSADMQPGAQADVPARHRTFVDLGCGKGRALLIAQQFQFSHIVGVEIAPDLAAIARRNTRSSATIRIVQADAASIVYPPGPLLLFLFHPFLAPVLRRVLRNLHAQLRQQPRACLLLYANPTYPHVMAQNPWLQPVWDRHYALSAADRADDRHGQTTEHYILYRATCP